MHKYKLHRFNITLILCCKIIENYEFLQYAEVKILIEVIRVTEPGIFISTYGHN